MIPAARLKFLRRVRDLCTLVNGDEGRADRLVRAVLHAWQQGSYPRLATRAPWGSSDFLSLPQVEQFASWLRSLQSFNDAAYWLATAYAIWVGDATRTARSLYFTPPRLADRVISNLVRHGASLSDKHWHDPACGGAAFLVPIAQGMARQLAVEGHSSKSTLRAIERNLSGSDLDQTLIYLSNQFLLMALDPIIREARYEPKIRITCADGLTARGLTGTYDVVACNPPYRKLKAAEVAKYARNYRDVIEGQPNVYGLFIERSLRLVREDGHVGLLTPTSFLSGQYFSKLRTQLLSRSSVVQLDVLSDRTSLFIDVEQETAVTTLRAKVPAPARPSTTSVSVLGPDGEFTDVGQCYLPNCGKPWAIPRSVSDTGLLLAAERSTSRLSDYGYVAKIGHLVAYRDTRRRHATPVTASKGKLTLPLVWATDISPSGSFVHGREQRMSRPQLYVEVDARAPSGVTKRPAVLLQRLTSSDQKRRLVAAAVPKEWLEKHVGFVSENHVIVVEQLEDRGWKPEMFAKLLQSVAIDQVFRTMSGASNVSLFELNELPLPHPEQLALELSNKRPLEEAIRSTYLRCLSSEVVAQEVARHGH